MNPAQGWTRVNFLGPDPTRPKTNMAVTNNRTIYLKSHYCNIVSIEVDLEILITCLMQNTSKLQTCTSSYFTRLKIKKIVQFLTDEKQIRSQMTIFND